jgi:hypothetical protein
VIALDACTAYSGQMNLLVIEDTELEEPKIKRKEENTMRPVEQKDLMNYRFLSNVRYAPGGERAAFVVANADEEDNSYERRLWLYENGAVRQLTDMGKEGGFVWLDEQRLLFPAVRTTKEKKRAEAKETFTSYYMLDLRGGEAVFYHNFLEYGPYAGDITGRQNGAMISMSTEKAVAYALGTLQERGQLFVGPGDECYEGMLVGERSKPGDMVVNIARTKSLGNQRSSTADIAVQLTPPKTYTLEEALEYIMDDELVEVTPQSIRMRKRILNETERRKWRVKNGLVNK